MTRVLQEERDGIPASRVYLAAGPWERLFEFLCERFPRVPADVLQQRLAAGDIVDEHGVPQHPDSPYIAGRWLWYFREVPDEVAIPFDIPVIHRDARLLAVDKPHFMATTPGGRYLRHTALVRLRRELELPTLSPMHRLDRDTAGVLLFCIDPAYRGQYQSLFQSRAVYKEYEAIAAPPDRLAFPLVHRSRMVERAGGFTMHEVPGEPNSETRIEQLTEPGRDGMCQFRLVPHSGRKHQLRVHMSALGMPIVNDAFYPDLSPAVDAADFSRPLQLLARAIEFRDPVDGKVRRYESARQLSGA